MDAHDASPARETPLRRYKDFRTAVIRLNVWPAGLTLFVAAVLCFWLPLQAAVLALTVPVFAAASAVLFMFVVHSRSLRGMPVVERAAGAQLACVAIATFVAQPVAEVIESVVAVPGAEPTYWFYSIIPCIAWVGTAIRVQGKAEWEGS